MQPLLTQDEAADLLKLSVRTLERLRTTSGGPKFLKIMHSVRYRQSDVDMYRPLTPDQRYCRKWCRKAAKIT